MTMGLLYQGFPLTTITSDAPMGGNDERDEVRRELISGLPYNNEQSLHHFHHRDEMLGGCDRDYSEERDDVFFGPSGQLSDVDDDEDSGSVTSDEASDRPADLVPMAIRSSRRNRQRSSTKTGFFDFYKTTDEDLGAGAYASVRTCVSRSSGHEFAVKIVDKSVQSHTRSRILREVETFNICRDHPNIVQLIEWFEDSDNFYMVFEKMNGGPLLDHIQRKAREGKAFTEQEACHVAKEIASALKFLHDRGIAHRDVKPENILCTKRDHVSPVKLCDLDLASKAVLHQSRMPQVASEPDLASPVGSAEFMAPEVVDAFVGDALKYDKRCDMWSLGVIIYIMLCGYPPFYGDCSQANCGWDEGYPCDECQNNLFARIQAGEYEFPEEDWTHISYSAKELIRNLLVRNVRKRYTADEVLKHPWISGGAPDTSLLTPGNLLRNDSARDVHQISEHFNVMNRIVAARLSARLEIVGSAEEEESSSLDGSPPIQIQVPVGTQLPDIVSHASPTSAPPGQRMKEYEEYETEGDTTEETGESDGAVLLSDSVPSPAPSMVDRAPYLPTYYQDKQMSGMIQPTPYMDPHTGIMMYPVQCAPIYYDPQTAYGEQLYDPRFHVNNNVLLTRNMSNVAQMTDNFHGLSVNGPYEKNGSRGITPPPPAELESCQSAIARQDSSSEVRNAVQREQQVEV